MSLTEDLNRYLKIDCHHLEGLRNYYNGLTLASAIKNAAEGLNPDGKMNSHQYLIGKKKGSIAANEMLKHINNLKNSKSFQDIFKITEHVKNGILGLGNLWSYDTALRIGFNLNILPDQVYIQRGVIKGVKKALNGEKPKGRSLSLTVFPKEFQLLQPYQAENFLCIWGKGNCERKC